MMKTKDWLDDVDDNANVTISALKLKAWAQQARLIASSLTFLREGINSDTSWVLVFDLLMLVSQTSSELEQSVLDVLRAFREGGVMK